MKKRDRRRGGWWPLLAVAAVASALALLIITTPTQPKEDNAVVILDTLPNTTGGEGFATQCRALLEPAGYTVKVYTGEEATVERVKNLGASPVIILRVHSSVFDDGVWFYTGEPYSSTEHVLEQLTNELHIGRTSPAANFTFAIGSTYIRNNLKGRLGGALVVLMGCDGLRHSDLAEAFTSSGASAYVSWNGPVTVEQTDEATLELLRSLVEDRVTLDTAIGAAMEGNSGFNSTLISYSRVTGFTLGG